MVWRSLDGFSIASIFAASQPPRKIEAKSVSLSLSLSQRRLP